MFARNMATSTRHFATLTLLSIYPSRSDGTPAYHWKRVVPSRAMTERRICWKCTVLPKCRIRNRDQIARMLGRSPACINLFEGHVGGGFGIRGELYPEDVLVCLAALRLGRPVKWIEDRREHFTAANHSRQQLHRVRAAIDRDGRILAIDDEFFHDQGGYIRTHGSTVPDLTAAMLPGPYRIPAYRATGHIRLTNKTPCGTYRAPGRYEGTFVRERLIEAVATRCGINSVEVRRRNLIDKSEMPFTRDLDTLGTHVVLDSGDYAGLLDKALGGVGWTELQAQLKRRRQAGELVGAGIAMFVEKSGLGPFDTVRITIDAAGFVEVVTGAASVGQGVETVIAQICADALGVRYDRITVIHGQTDRIEKGFGAFASRVTVMTGEATRLAATKLRDKALAVAAEMMQMSAEQLNIVDGEIVCVDQIDGPSIGLAEVAAALAPGATFLAGREPGLAADGLFESRHMTYPYGVHVAVVRLAGDTGAVHIERYLVAYDVGKAVNPMLVEGQIVGGAAQGIGGALYEEFLYDDRGEPLSVTFADYLMPTAREVPHIDVIISEDAPSSAQSPGIKGGRRRRDQRGWSGHRRGYRRCTGTTRRGDALAGIAAAYPCHFRSKALRRFRFDLFMIVIGRLDTANHQFGADVENGSGE